MTVTEKLAQMIAGIDRTLKVAPEVNDFMMDREEMTGMLRVLQQVSAAVAAEREACAKVAEAAADNTNQTLREVAAAIRARG